MRNALQRIWTAIVAAIAGVVVGFVISIATPHNINEPGKIVRWWLIGGAVGAIVGFTFGGPKKSG
jgi:hypothetical protein